MLINQSRWKNDERRGFITAIKCKCETISSKTWKYQKWFSATSYESFLRRSFVRYRKVEERIWNFRLMKQRGEMNKSLIIAHIMMISVLWLFRFSRETFFLSSSYQHISRNFFLCLLSLLLLWKDGRRREDAINYLFTNSKLCRRREEENAHQNKTIT